MAPDIVLHALQSKADLQHGLIFGVAAYVIMVSRGNKPEWRFYLSCDVDLQVSVCLSQPAPVSMAIQQQRA